MLADGLGDRIWLAASAGHPDLVGLSLAEVGELWGKDPIEAAFDLIVADQATTHIVVEQHNEADIRGTDAEGDDPFENRFRVTTPASATRDIRPPLLLFQGADWTA